MRNIFVFIWLAAISCTQDKATTKQHYTAEESLFAAKQVADYTKSIRKQALIDTDGIYMAPVKVLKYSLVKRENSTYKNVYIAYKNISAKKVEGVKFSWYGETVFGDPADMGGSILKGFGNGFTDEMVGPGKVWSGEWEVLSGDAKKIIAVWPTEVVYGDGTKWTLKHD